MNESKLEIHPTSRVTSHIPGRLRVKLHPQQRHPENMDRVKQHMETQEGVHQVNLNKNAGSVTVKYDPKKIERNKLFGLLEDVDVIVGDVTDVPQAGEAPVKSEKTGKQVSFAEAFEDLNIRLSKITGMHINLRIVLPLIFAGAGAWSIYRRGLLIEAVPGFAFLWLALDIFVKLNPHQMK